MTDSAAKKQTSSNIPDKILEQVSAFPSMPKAGVKLRALLGEEDVSVEKIEKILRQDPGLAANVLRLANLMCQPDSSEVSGEGHNLPYPSVLEKLRIESEHYEAFAKKARDWMEKMSDTLTFD